MQNRGSLTVWIAEDELNRWVAAKSKKRKRGRQKEYSDHAIETSLTIGRVFKLPLRQTVGFLRSLFELLNVNRRVPHHSTICRRAQKLGKVPLYHARGNKPVHVLVDSSGLKIHVGRMRKPPQNRDWRKLHIAVDEMTGDVIACDLTSKSARDAARVPALLRQIDRPISSLRADSAYDTNGVYEAVEHHIDDRSPRVLIPPKKNAQLDPTSEILRERNRKFRSRCRLGKRRWHTESGYSKRALVETMYSRYKTILGPTMRSRNLAAQRVEARIGCKILNRMAALGMPDGYRET